MTGAREASSASLDNPEQVMLSEVSGEPVFRVDPYFVADPAFEVECTLTIEVAPLDGGTGDGTDDSGTTEGNRDGDDVPDDADACPDHAGVATNGCPATGEVRLVQDGEPITSQTVSTLDGPDAFDLVADVARNATTFVVEWLEDDTVIATQTVNVVRRSDSDGDGHSNGKEEAHGTDPQDPTSYPRRGGRG